jgi:hypothetical protein
MLASPVFGRKGRDATGARPCSPGGWSARGRWSGPCTWRPPEAGMGQGAARVVAVELVALSAGVAGAAGPAAGLAYVRFLVAADSRVGA